MAASNISQIFRLQKSVRFPSSKASRFLANSLIITRLPIKKKKKKIANSPLFVCLRNQGEKMCFYKKMHVSGISLTDK